MNIYHLDYDGIDYDCFSGHVIIAPNEETARDMAPSGDEGKDVWVNINRSTCVLIGVANEEQPRIVLSSFHAG